MPKHAHFHFHFHFLGEHAPRPPKSSHLRRFSNCLGYQKSLATALGVRVFCESGVGQIHKQRPGSLTLYCRKPNTTVPLQDKETAPLSQWLNSVTEDSAHKRVERAKDQASCSRMPPARSSLVSLESSVVVVGHRVTQDGLDYLVKGTQEPDILGIWTPRENVNSSLVTACTRRPRASRCETSTQMHFLLSRDTLVENYLIEGIK